MISDDDLLGGTTTEEPAPELPDSPFRERVAALRAATAGRSFIEANKLILPVTRNFLAEVFMMDPATVRKRLIRCPTVGHGTEAGNKRDLYDFREAVAYLVPPKMDVEQYIKSLDAAKLPNHINKMFWEALQQRLKYMIASGDAWATEDVLDVFGTVFKTIKDRTQLWTETMRDQGKLTDEQMSMLGVMVEELQNDLHSELIAIPASRRTVPIGEKPIGDAGEGTE